ncbi:MAG: gluconate 2-dehydrogenase subunit 3 family protein [Acidobacteriota bacterium]
MKKKTTDSGARFERRDILKLMTTMPAAALVSLSPLASEVAQAAPQQSAAQSNPKTYQPKVFTPHEWRTLRILSDLILPADDRSGSATQVGVPEFIDDWVNVKQGNLLDEIRGGLTWLDMESNRLFKYDFAECSTVRQKQILDRIAYPEKAAPTDAGAVAFFNTLRDLMISGFFTSRMGIRDLPYIGNEPQEKWNGCPPQVLAKLGLGGGKTTA